MLTSRIASQIGTCANYFGDLIYQLLCEYSAQLDRYYQNSDCFAPFVSDEMNIDLKQTPAKFICHAYPTLYDLHLQHDNDNAKVLNRFLTHVISSENNNESLRDVYYAILNFKAMASAKQAQHQLKSTITPMGVRGEINGHPLRLISLYITPACQALSLSLEKTQQYYLENHTDQPRFSFNTMINRTNGFINFANKQSIPIEA